MPTNDLIFNQAATVINDIQEQATGQKAIAPTNTSDFVTTATTLLKMGKDPILNAVSQVLTRDIFSIRPYERKFGLVEVSESAYGNHIRKFKVADKPIREDQAYKWPVAFDATEDPATGEGESVDQQKILKPVVLQTNFYGQNVWSDGYTLFYKQLENAFRGPEQLAGFTAMVTRNITDKLEQVRENIARATVANFIGGILDEGNQSRVVHLLTEYNALTGLSLTAQTVYQPSNFRAFVQWAFSRIFTVSKMMTERSTEYQTVVNDLPINQHTPQGRQKLMVYSPAETQIQMMAMSNTYHDTLVEMAGHESVNFWQSIKTPDSIQVTPGRIGADGGVVTGEAINQANVFALLCDEEAMGYATTQSWAAPAPFNAAGGYTTTWLHETQRCWNDHTEKGVVFLLD